MYIFWHVDISIKTSKKSKTPTEEKSSEGAFLLLSVMNIINNFFWFNFVPSIMDNRSLVCAIRFLRGNEM